MKPKSNFGKSNYIRRGKNWELISENQGFGYASCVQYVPHSNGKSLVSVASGLYYSYDGGYSWEQLAADKIFYNTFVDKRTAIAAGKNKMD
jgi:hypothetical protein